MNIRPYGWMPLLLLAIVVMPSVLRAQLKLGENPASINKSSILELESSTQGLLLPRVPDTTVSTLATAPDGTIIYFTPLKSLLVRKVGRWQPVTDAASVIPFLHIRTGVADSSGLRLENLTSSSAITPGAAALGVDANGKVVRTNKIVYFSGGAGADGAAGGTAAVDEVTKVWVAEVSNTSTGVQTINFPGNISFTHILNIQVTAKGGSGIVNAPIAVVTSNTNSSLSVLVMESADVTTPSLALEAHVDTATKLYIRVEGN